MRAGWVVWVVLLGCATPGGTTLPTEVKAEPAPSAPVADEPRPLATLQQLEAAAALTTERASREPLSWSATHSVGGTSEIRVDVLSGPEGRRMRVQIHAGGQTAKLAQIIEKDGLWYVTDDTGRSVYRPYEAPLSLPAIYLFLSRSELLVLQPEQAASLGAIQRVEGREAVFVEPYPEATRQQIARMIAELTEGGKPIPANLKGAQEMIDRGLETRVDVELGVITQLGSERVRSRIHDVQFLAEVPAEEFDTSAFTPGKETQPLVFENPSDWTLIGHCGAWRPTSRSSCDTDSVILNVVTGEMRRVPHPPGASMPGSLTKSRTKALVVGNSERGALQPYLVDLLTAESQPIGGEQFAHGQSFFPLLSPDEKTVAIAHKGPNEAVLEWQLYLVDLATSHSRALGQPFDGAFLNWLPDGNGLIYLVRDGKESKTISRIDLQGRIKPIREGDWPVLLPGGTRILYRDLKTELWNTCDLNGRNVKLFGDGYAKHGQPDYSPDGKRLMFIHFTDAGPVPVIVSLAKPGVPKPVKVRPGLWAYPRWR